MSSPEKLKGLGMLYIDDVRLKKLSNIPLGHLVVAIHDEAAGSIGIVTRADRNQREVLLLGPIERLRPASQQDGFLDLGLAKVRFDPKSVFKPEQPLPNGALVLIDKGFGVFFSTEDEKRASVSAAGQRAFRRFSKQWDQPAFGSWEACVKRDREIVSVLKVDLLGVQQGKTPAR